MVPSTDFMPTDITAAVADRDSPKYRLLPQLIVQAEDGRGTM
jgi:hypothetical protein